MNTSQLIIILSLAYIFSFNAKAGTTDYRCPDNLKLEALNFNYKILTPHNFNQGIATRSRKKITLNPAPSFNSSYTNQSVQNENHIFGACKYNSFNIFILPNENCPSIKVSWKNKIPNMSLSKDTLTSSKKTLYSTYRKCTYSSPRIETSIHSECTAKNQILSCK